MHARALLSRSHGSRQALPRGNGKARVKSAEYPRFVIQKHAALPPRAESYMLPSRTLRKFSKGDLR
jgi:hypothetical protein